MGDIFTAFEISGVRDRPAELGAFSPESLYVRYDFNYQDLVDAFDQVGRVDDPPEPLKTAMHETTHLYHTLTTPFGFLVYALRRTQAILVQTAIQDLRRNHGQRIRLPLVSFIRSLPESIRRSVEHYLAMWYQCELFIALALDGFEAWNEQLVRNPYLIGFGHVELFARTQALIARTYREVERMRRLTSGDLVDERTLPFIDYRADDFESRDDFLMLMQTVGLDELNMIFITESAGTMAESWGVDRPAADIWERLKRSATNRGVTGAVGLKQLQRGLKASTASELVQSYLALCELTLFGPVLPQHRALRSGGHGIWELLPTLRWWRLVGEAVNVRPMRGLEDQPRYVNELCDALGWVRPQDIRRVTAERHEPFPGDLVESIYLEANDYREHTPAIFQDYNWTLFGTGPAHTRFRSLFNFPVIQYRDRTVYLRDKDRLFELTQWHLLRLALRMILLRDRVALRMPYGPSDDKEVAYLRQNLIDSLEALIGVRVNGLTLAS